MKERLTKYRNRHQAIMSRKCLYFVVLLVLVLTSCATLPENVDRPLSAALQDTADTTIGKAVKNTYNFTITGEDDGLDILRQGRLIIHLEFIKYK